MQILYLTNAQHLILDYIICLQTVCYPAQVNLMKSSLIKHKTSRLPLLSSSKE